MNNYELLLNQIYEEIPVIELPLLERGLEGNYFDGVIFIDSSLPAFRKREILSEEYAHYKTSVGTIINYNSTNSRKQELKARSYSFELIVTLDDLIDCHKHRLTNVFECAEHLDLSEDVLKESFKYFSSKFGISHSYKNYLFTFSDESVMILDKKIS